MFGCNLFSRRRGWEIIFLRNKIIVSHPCVKPEDYLYTKKWISTRCCEILVPARWKQDLDLLNLCLVSIYFMFSRVQLQGHIQSQGNSWHSALCFDCYMCKHREIFLERSKLLGVYKGAESGGWEEWASARRQLGFHSEQLIYEPMKSPSRQKIDSITD